MSHDAWIEMPDPDGGDPIEMTPWRNHTRNTSRMWHWAVSEATGGEVAAIQDTDGWPVPKAYSLLVSAVDLMERNPDKLREWNPPNGWGSYESALEFLRCLIEDCRRCRQVPGAVLRWSW